MNAWLVTGLVVLFASLASGQVMQFRAFQQLTSDQRNQVVTFRASRGAIRLIVVMGLMLSVTMVLVPLAALGVRLGPVVDKVIMAIALAPAVWSHATYFRGLRALDLPDQYLVAARRSRLLIYLGWVPVLGAAILLGSGRT